MNSPPPKLKQLLKTIEPFILNPMEGLPEDLFLFISRLTPLVNVDLLIKNDNNETLLTWRNDGLLPAGWHIPGGIIRFKEKMARRIALVARNELGAEVTFEPAPLAINEAIEASRNVRGHFVSLLFNCRLASRPAEHLRYNGGQPEAGQWAWHAKCPHDIISVHEMYRKYF